MANLAIRKAKNGKGLFATKSFKIGQKIFKIKGKLVNVEEHSNRAGSVVDNTFRIGLNTYLSPQGELGDFLNHSCEPNSRIKKIGQTLWVVALIDIGKNREITFDYSTILAADDFWHMRCNCGYKNCRKLIRKYTLLPKKLLSTYLDLEIIPSYILSIAPY